MNNPQYYNAAYLAVFYATHPTNAEVATYEAMAATAAQFAAQVDNLIPTDPGVDDDRADCLSAICESFLSGRLGSNVSRIPVLFGVATPGLIPVTPTGEGQGNVFTYDEGAPNQGFTFGVWADLIAALPGIQAPQIYIAKNSNVPAGTWDMHRATLLSPTLATGNIILTCADGTTFHNLQGVNFGLGLDMFNTGQEAFTFSAPEVGVPILLLYLASVVRNSGTFPLFDVGPNGFLVLANFASSFIVNGGPIVRLSSNSTLIASCLFSPPGSVAYPVGWVVGDADCTIEYLEGVDFTKPVTPGFLGTVVDVRTAKTPNLLWPDGSEATPSLALESDATAGLYALTTPDGDMVAAARGGHMAMGWQCIPGFGSVWVFNQSQGGLRIHSDAGTELVSAGIGGPFDLDNSTSIGFSGTTWQRGNGDPNGVVTGSPGDLYSNTAGGVGTSLFVKESGVATDTGWVGK